MSDDMTLHLPSGVVLHAVDELIHEREPVFACPDCVQWRAVVVEIGDHGVTLREWHEAGCEALDYGGAP